MKIDGTIDRRSHLVDGCDVVLRIDEQPLPIERDDINPQRLGVGGYGPLGCDPAKLAIRIQQMRARPGDRSDADDDQERDRPDNELKMSPNDPNQVHMSRTYLFPDSATPRSRSAPSLE